MPEPSHEADLARRGRAARALLAARRRLPEVALGAAAVPSAVRLVGDHDRAWTVMIVSFTPLAALGVAAVAALLGGLGRWRGAAAGMALLALNVAWQAPLWVGEDPPRTGRPVVVLTTNILYGWADLGAVVREVAERDVELLGVVELTPEAVGALGAAGLDRLLPYRVLRPGPGAHGSGLWSRHPLTEQPAWDGVHAGPGATARIGERDVTVRVVHPYRTGRFSASAYRADNRALRDHLAGLPEDVPAVVLGDFNTTRDHQAFRRLLSDGWRDATEVDGAGFVRTWSPWPWSPSLMQLDHILINRQFGVASTDVVRIPGTDHRAVVAELVLREPERSS